jgi:DNA-3-methyladenine glycosylase
MNDRDLRLRREPAPWARERLAAPAPEAAAELLGALLVRDDPSGQRVVARIVEVEAYREDDPASHSAAGLTTRTAPMFAQPGTAYVYRSYGIHWCLNVTVEEDGVGAAALVRAATVLEGLGVVRARRPTARGDHELLRGPGRLTVGLDVDRERHAPTDRIAGEAGLALADDGWRPKPESVMAGPRVGIRHAAEVPWRYRLDGVAAVSPYRRHARAVPAARERSG